MPTKTQLIGAAWTIAILVALLRVNKDVRDFILND